MGQKIVLTIFVVILLGLGGTVYYSTVQKEQGMREIAEESLAQIDDEEIAEESVAQIDDEERERKPTEKKYLTFYDWILFDDKKLGFSFKYPPDWEFSRLPQESYDAPPIKLLSPNGSRLIISPEDSPSEHRSFTVNGYITRYSKTIDGYEATIEQLSQIDEFGDQEVEAIVRIDSLEFLPKFMVKMYYGSTEDITIFHNILNKFKFSKKFDDYRPATYKLEPKKPYNFEEVSLVYYDEQGDRSIIEDNIYSLISEVPQYSNWMRILVALPETGKIILQEMHPEAGPIITYSYDLSRQEVTLTENTKYTRGPNARLSPDGTKIANHGNLKENAIYVTNLISDTTNKVVELSNPNETLISSCELYCTISIAWVGNSKLKYGVFKPNEDNLFNELIEERVISF